MAINIVRNLLLSNCETGHAEILAKNGCRVKIITAKGETIDKGIQLDLIPEIGSGWPENKLVTEELKQGIVSERFQR